jgi:hypothetical protein
MKRCANAETLLELRWNGGLIGIPWITEGTRRARMFSLFLEHLWKFLQDAFRILRRLWLEVTGAVFLALAGFGAVSAVKELRAYQNGGELWKPIAAVSFVILMGAFGVQSFFRSRRFR